jgi:aminotransferase in exopolysaccharide biosynthesis
MIYQETIDFIKNLYGTDEFIPLHPPIFLGNEKKYLNDCIDSTFVSSVGKYVDKFEEMIAEFTGAKKAVVCVNGTSALYIALKLVGVERGDEILTQSLSFIATANAISYCDANPVFLDVDMDTLGLSPVAVRKWLEENAEVRDKECFNKVTGNRIKACVPMHTFGHPVHLDEIVKICSEYSIELVEDAAESLGSFYKGKHTGTFGRVGAISFNGNKTITTGGGGMLLFQDEELAKYAKHITTQAKIPHRWEFRHDAIGYNLRMPNINAALGCAQLEKIDEILANKRETALQYNKYFENIDDIKFFNEPKDCKSNFWFNTVLLENREKRDEFLKETNDSGVMTRPIWELMNRLEMFKDCQVGELTNCEHISDRVVNIPSGYRKQ